MAQTAIQLAIEKIDEQIEIAQVCKIESSKIKDATSMNRHHGMKIALVFMRQELVNLLEMEKQQIKEHGVKCYVSCCGEPDRIGDKVSEKIYKTTFKSE